MRYLIDVDGVVADFTNHLLAVVGSELTLADVVQWDIFALMKPEQATRAKIELCGTEFWLTQPLVPGAAEGIANIRNEGHEIVWVTTPWHSCEGWEYARRKWLKQHFKAKTADIVFAGRKELIRGDRLIDDKPQHVEAWAQANPDGKAYLFDAPYNRDFDWVYRMGWS